MRKLILLLPWIFLSTVTSAMVTLENSNGLLRVQFNLPEAPLKQLTVDKKNMELATNLPVTIDPGRPQVPFYTFFLIGRPGDFEVDVNLGRQLTLKSFGPVMAPERPCRCGDHDHRSLLDDDEYSGLQSDPQSPFRMDYLGDFRGVEITRLLIFPHRTDSIEKTFTLYPELSLSVLRVDGKSPTAFSQSFTPMLEKIMAGSKSPTILVVAPQGWIKTMDNWAKWKRRQGLLVRFESLEKIGTAPENIREYLRHEYSSPVTTFQYAILVGHENLLPTFYVRTSTNDATPSDLPYFTMGGEDDHIPDVLYGRMVADKEEDLKLQIEKIMDYEKAGTGSTGDKDFSRGIGIASDEGQNPSDVEYLFAAEKPFVDNENFQFQNFLQKDSSSVPENINEYIGRGISWMTYIGHGSGYSWSSLYSQEYASPDVAALRPVRVRPVVIDVSCQNGRFIYDGHLGERFINEKSRENDRPLGATAYYGGSVDITWDPPAIMAQGISRSYYEHRLNRLGEILLSGQMSLYGRIVETKNIIENFTWYHLLGDPSLFIRTGHHRTLSAVLSQDRHILYIKDEKKRPLSGITVTFSERNGSFVTGMSDSRGRVKIPNPTKSFSYSIFKKGFSYLEGVL